MSQNHQVVTRKLGTLFVAGPKLMRTQSWAGRAALLATRATSFGCLLLTLQVLETLLSALLLLQQ